VPNLVRSSWSPSWPTSSPILRHRKLGSVASLTPYHHIKQLPRRQHHSAPGSLFFPVCGWCAVRSNLPSDPLWSLPLHGLSPGPSRSQACLVPGASGPSFLWGHTPSASAVACCVSGIIRFSLLAKPCSYSCACLLHTHPTSTDAGPLISAEFNPAQLGTGEDVLPPVRHLHRVSPAH
jgi:hypothetical protein